MPCKNTIINHRKRELGLCIVCGKISVARTCTKCRDRRRPQRRLQKRRQYYRDKQKVLKYYGGECACCHEKNKYFLTIDHINNDGAEHRRKIKRTAGSVFYSWLIANKFPEGFQILCWNCNCGKRMNGGVCPHVNKKYDHEQSELNLDHRHLWDSDINLFAECKKCRQSNYIETEIGFIKISDWCPVSDAEYEQRLEKFGLKQARRLVPRTTGNRSEQLADVRRENYGVKEYADIFNS